MVIRDWALKCGTSFSMLYEQLAKDVYNELYDQFYRHQNKQIWATSITATFELIDRYGFDYFETEGARGMAGGNGDNDNEKSKRTHRQLYNKMGSMEDQEDEDASQTSKSSLLPPISEHHVVVLCFLTVFPSISLGVDLMYLFGHFLETLNDATIVKALISGFCRLVLGGHYTSEDLVSKLLLRFFNPATEPEINQVLCIFFETLNRRRRQECLQKALMHTLSIILEAPNDNPLHDIKPEEIIKYVISSTRPIYCAAGVNIHYEIAVSFFKAMDEHMENKELLKLLSKELLTLDVGGETSIKEELKAAATALLEKALDSKTETYIKSFHALLSGTYRPPQRVTQTAPSSSVDPRDIEEIPSDDEGDGASSMDNGSSAPSRGITNGQGTVSDLEEEDDEDEHDISSIHPGSVRAESFASVASSQLSQPVGSSTQIVRADVHTASQVSTNERPPTDDVPVRRKQSRERPATSLGEEGLLAVAKLRKTAAGKKPVRGRNGRNKSNASQKTDDDDDDEEEVPPRDASKENILDATVRFALNYGLGCRCGQFY